MSSRKETERSKFIQEKCQTLLTQMLRDEDNKYCVDCDAKGPRWASWNIGVFLCIRCAGIHRNLGVHISKVKSVNLDTWTPEQVVSLQQMGNSRARAVYEAQLPDGFRRPQNDSALESFIRAKYEHKKYVAREWVPLPAPKVDWNKEIEEELDRQKRKKKSISGTSLNLSSGEKKNIMTVKTPLPAPLPKPKVNSSSPKTARNEIHPPSASSDLLGLSTPLVSQSTSPQSNSLFSTQTLNDNDAFSNFLSASVADNITEPVRLTKDVNVADNLAKQEADFFNQSTPSEKEKAKLTKDSILALYSASPKPPICNYNQFNGAVGFSTQQPHGSPNQPQQLYSTQQYSQKLIGNQFGHQATIMPGNTIPIQMQSNPNMFIGNHANIASQQANINMLSMGKALPGHQISSVNFPSQLVQTQNQTFAQFPPANFSQTTPITGNLAQQFGNINMGNVWQ